MIIVLGVVSFSLIYCIADKGVALPHWAISGFPNLTYIFKFHINRLLDYLLTLTLHQSNPNFHKFNEPFSGL